MTSMRSLNQDLNLKASMMSLANVDDEVKYYTKYLNLKNEIDAFVERKKKVLLEDIKEKEKSLNFLKKERERREEENKNLNSDFNEVCVKESSLNALIKNNKEELMMNFLEICKKRKEISKIFDNRIGEYKKMNSETENRMKELNLYMNIFKLRIINIDEIQNGLSNLKAYFVNKDNTLKYYEVNLKDEEVIKVKKFIESFIDNLSKEEKEESENTSIRANSNR